MMTVIAYALLLGPCELAAPIDEGQSARCSGILVSADTVREALANKKELQVRRAFVCPECPGCPECPTKPQRNVYTWALGGILAGALMASGVILVALTGI